MNNKIKYFIWIFFALLISFYSVTALAADMVEVNPHVIDEKAKASEIIEKIIKIKNTTEFKVDIYPIVNDLSITDGKQEFLNPNQLDKTTSLARWIRIQRGVIQLMPGEETEIPLKIEINTSAVPGKRYAVIAFPSGSNSYKAEERAKNEVVPQIMLTIEIEDESVEKAQLIRFGSRKNTYFNWPADFTISLKNIGNVNIIPSGSMYIYDRRDQLLDKIEINQNSELIEGNETKDFNLSWDKEKGIGKFKAKLELEYGAKEKRDLGDTIYFWVLPVYFLIFFIGGLAIMVIILVYYLFQKTYIAHRHNYDHALDNKQDKEEKPGVINLKSR